MSFTLPAFAEMKGYAVRVMNHLANQPALRASEVGFQFPVELRSFRGYEVFLVNGTSGVICRQGGPRKLLREKDAHKPFNEDAWAFVSVHIVTEQPRASLQEILFPRFAPYMHVIEVFAEWEDAVYNAIIQAMSSAMNQKLVASIGKKGKS